MDENPYNPPQTPLESLPPSNRENWSAGWSAVHTVCGVGFLVFTPMIVDYFIGKPFSAGSVSAVILAPVIYGFSRLFAHLELPK
jgi:hypothetical protein